MLKPYSDISRYFLKLILVVTLILLPLNLAACNNTGSSQKSLTIAVASSLKPVIEDFTSLFRNDYPEVHVTLAAGSSGALAEQIKNGAPYDLFISANQHYSQRLGSEGMLDPADSRKLARGKLTIISKSQQHTKNIKAILTDPSVIYIGIANPRLAPYGSSAIKFMESEGVLNSLQTKLVYTENVAQTLQLVLSKNAELGFVSKSLVASQGVENFGLVYELPSDYNSNLVVTSGAVLKKDSHPMTLNYLDMLSSSDYKHIWETFEYEMLGS